MNGCGSGSSERASGVIGLGQGMEDQLHLDLRAVVGDHDVILRGKCPACAAGA